MEYRYCPFFFGFSSVPQQQGIILCSDCKHTIYTDRHTFLWGMTEILWVLLYCQGKLGLCKNSCTLTLLVWLCTFCACHDSIFPFVTVIYRSKMPEVFWHLQLLVLKTAQARLTFSLEHVPPPRRKARPVRLVSL